MDKYYMPRYLDEPYKIAFFTVDEVILFVTVFFSALMFFNAPLYGFVVGGIAVAIIKKVKGQEGCYFLLHLAYWYLPPIINFRSTPHSYIREILG